MSNPIRLRLAAALLMASALSATPAFVAPARADSTFTLDHVIFQGNALVPTDALVAADGLTDGQKIDRDGIIAAFQKVQDLYQSKNVGGSIQPTMTYPRPGHLNLTFQITEAAPLPVKVIQRTLAHETITGNVKVTADQLAPALTMKPGDVVTTAMEQADLNALGKVYRGANIAASITPQISYPTDVTVDLNYAIVENPPPAK